MSRRRTGVAAPLGQWVLSPLSRAGNKSRLLHLIFPHMDTAGHTFVDLFAGTMNVGVNVDAAHVVFNDRCPVLSSLHELLTSSTPDRLTAEVETLCREYGFPNTYEHGYEYYGGDSSRGVPGAIREPYLRLREDYNTGRFEGRAKQVAALTLVVHGYNHQIQLTRDLRWSTAPGKRDFHCTMRRKLTQTVERLTQMRPTILNLDFTDVDPTEFDNPFMYADPPYLLAAKAVGHVNPHLRWTEARERELYEYLDAAHDAGIPFALSNVLEHKGSRHTMLWDWVRARGHRLKRLDYSYANSSHTLKPAHRAARTVEVLVTSQ